jgi:NADPH-dependent 2,4-dienoyl-CoA reductase/sulfur reductase-like enzyme
MFARLSTNQKAFAIGGSALTVAGIYSYSRPKQQRREHILVVGGGTAGVGVAGMLHREGLKNVTIVEPSATHYYQPIWTLVGAGIKPIEQSARPMENVIPTGTKWIQQSVTAFRPEQNLVELDNGKTVACDYLVVASGMQSGWDKVPGLVEGLEKEDSGVVSIYHCKYANKTFKTFEKVKELEHPKLVFTMSPTPIKCAGAPQKIMWLLDDTLRRLGKRATASIAFWTPGGTMFGVPYNSDKLEKLRIERGVDGKIQPRTDPN